MLEKKVMSDQQYYHFAFIISAKEALIKDEDKLSLILKNVDPKTLYMTARPGRDRAFIATDRFMNTWITNNEVFTQNPPQMAILHTQIVKDDKGLCKSIPLSLSDPIKENDHSWKFKLKNRNLAAGIYKDVIIVFDWLPAPECPEPIKLELPSLFL